MRTWHICLLNLFILLSSAFAPSAEARWKTTDEANLKVLVDNTKIKLKRSGAYHLTNQYQAQILNKKGLESIATTTFEYDKSNTSMKILNAYVINDGKRIPVESKFIEDKPVASTSTGFSSSNKIVVAFPQVRVGSIISYESVKEVRKSLLSGHFYFSNSFGWSIDLKGQSLSVESEVPLNFKVDGPDGYLDVNYEKKQSSYELKIILKKDAYLVTMDERSPFRSWTARPLRPTFEISNVQSWKEIVEKLADGLEDLLAAPLPPTLATQVEEIKKKRTFIEQANAIHSYIAESFRYMGDWRSSDSGYFPRALDEILNTRFGDCKDFAYLMALMLRKLGYKADLVAVERDENPELNFSVPTTAYFNHMIVRAVDPTGRVFWIDPTNSIPFTGGKWSDIAGRPALPLSPKTEQLENIPPVSAADNIVEMDMQAIHMSKSESENQFTCYLSEYRSANLVPFLKQKTKKQLDDYIESLTSLGRRVISSTIEAPDLSGNVVRPLKFATRLVLENDVPWTSAGYGKYIPADLEDYLKIQPEHMVKGIDLSNPETVISRIRLSAKQLVGSLPENCSVESPWLRSERTFQILNDIFITETRTERTARYVTNEELKSPAFKKLQDDIRSCLSQRMFIFKEL
ncbi:MAG: hypothetical protein RIR26_1089 [Pseudomonadota bacterium]|jgi:transglutaminase-like putative cysteine protease